MKDLGIDILTLFMCKDDTKLLDDLLTSISGNNLTQFREGLKYQTVILNAYCKYVYDHSDFSTTGKLNYDCLFSRTLNMEACRHLDYIYNNYLKIGTIDSELSVPYEYRVEKSQTLFDNTKFGKMCYAKRFDFGSNMGREFSQFVEEFVLSNYDYFMPIKDILTFGYNKSGKFGMYGRVPVDSVRPETLRIFKFIIEKITTKRSSKNNLLIDDYLDLVFLKTGKTSNIRIFGVEYSGLNARTAGGVKAVYDQVYNSMVKGGSANIKEHYNNINNQCKRLFDVYNKDEESKIITMKQIENLPNSAAFTTIVNSFTPKEKDLYLGNANASMNYRESSPYAEQFGILRETGALQCLMTNTAYSVKTVMKLLLVLSELTNPTRYNIIYNQAEVDFNLEDEEDREMLFDKIHEELKRLGIVGFNRLSMHLVTEVVKNISIITDDLSSRLDKPSPTLVSSLTRLSRTAHSYNYRMSKIA